MFNPRKQHDTQQKKKIVHDSSGLITHQTLSEIQWTTKIKFLGLWILDLFIDECTVLWLLRKHQAMMSQTQSLQVIGLISLTCTMGDIDHKIIRPSISQGVRCAKIMCSSTQLMIQARVKFKFKEARVEFKFKEKLKG